MKIITIGNVKGGVGKSTITSNLAVAAAKQGRKVIVIDSDVQKSSMDFRSIREKDDITAVSITTPTLHKDVQSFKNSHDIIFIDAGGRDSATFRSAIMASDLFIIPVLPSAYDIWATSDTLELLRECRAILDVETRLLMNQLQSNTIMAKEAQESLDEMAKSADCPVLTTRLYHRSAYKNAINQGKGVLEYEASGKAAKEISALYSEILSIISSPEDKSVKSPKKRGKK